jgi:hypothetical protein
VPYPPRPQLQPLPEFVGTAVPRPDPQVQARVERLVLEQYAAGRSLREIAELTDRSFSAVRNILDKHGVRRRNVGASRTDEPVSPTSEPGAPVWKVMRLDGFD